MSSVADQAAGQSVAIRNKARFWLDHIERKRATFVKDSVEYDPGPFFEYPALWFLVFAYINWPACFYFVKDGVSAPDIDELFRVELG
jgi:hypothetical protein